MYAKITIGKELNTPKGVILKLVSEILTDSPRLGVTSRLTIQMKNIVKMIKTLIITETAVANLRDDKVLARDTGNTNPNENTAPQKIYPYFE